MGRLLIPAAIAALLAMASPHDTSHRFGHASLSTPEIAAAAAPGSVDTRCALCELASRERAGVTQPTGSIRTTAAALRSAVLPASALRADAPELACSAPRAPPATA